MMYIHTINFRRESVGYQLPGILGARRAGAAGAAGSRVRAATGRGPRETKVESHEFRAHGQAGDLIARVSDFMDRHVYPAEKVYNDEMAAARKAGNPWIVVKVLEASRRKRPGRPACEPLPAREPSRRWGSPILNTPRSPETMGRVGFASEVFNRRLDGNMEVFERYGADWMRKNTSSRCSPARCAPPSS